MAVINLWTITWILSMPTGSMIFGGLLIWFTTLSHKTVAGMQHFASGILVAAVAWELAPILEPKTHEEKAAIIAGFLLAAFILTFLGRYDFKNWTRCHCKEKNGDEQHQLVDENYDAIRDVDLERQSQQHDYLPPGRFPLGLVIAVAFDCCIDGLLIGITYQASEGAGLITGIALMIEQSLLGVSLASSLVKCRVHKILTIVISIFIPFFVLFGGLLGCTLLADLEGHYLYAVVSFGAAGLLYLVTEELMIEAHEFTGTDKWYISLLFFYGFIFVVILDTYLPH